MRRAEEQAKDAHNLLVFKEAYDVPAARRALDAADVALEELRDKLRAQRDRQRAEHARFGAPA